MFLLSVPYLIEPVAKDLFRRSLFRSHFARDLAICDVLWGPFCQNEGATRRIMCWGVFFGFSSSTPCVAGRGHPFSISSCVAAGCSPTKHTMSRVPPPSSRTSLRGPVAGKGGARAGVPLKVSERRDLHLCLCRELVRCFPTCSREQHNKLPALPYCVMKDVLSRRTSKTSMIKPNLKRTEGADGDNDNIKVCVRIRPPNEREERHSTSPAWSWKDNTIAQTSTVSRNRGTGGVFTYDHLFDPGSDTEEIYENSVRRVILATMGGFHG